MNDPNTRQLSVRRRIAFVLLALTGGLLVSALVSEWLLGAFAARVAASEVMAPGLIGYDAQLGWRLTPGWTGRHRHHDFDVSYAIGTRGFRADDIGTATRGHLAVLGDSFTFGLGVNDDETFTHRLALDPPFAGMAVQNYGVPGYSTDQELLLLEKTVLARRPAHVVLVVCLINDVFDCARPFALQAAHAKPYVALEAGRLVWRGVPVPQEATKSRAAMQGDLARLVGSEPTPRGGLTGWLGKRHLMKRLNWFQPQPVPRDEAWYRERFADDMAVFRVVLERVRDVLSERAVELTVALLPGRARVDAPRSSGARYQDFLRRWILAESAALGLDTVDLTEALAERSDEGLYHPNEGHLNARGHAVVADAMRRALGGTHK